VTKQYDDIVTKAAVEMVKAMREIGCVSSGLMPTVYAVPTTEERDGEVVVVPHGYPAPLGGVVVRPNDNGASAHTTWFTTPYDSVWSILWHALRIQPILPLPGGRKEIGIINREAAARR
jgi:hypothetical protein